MGTKGGSAAATAFGGREGRVQTADGTLDVVLSPATTPEQLFAAAYAASFGSAVAEVARSRRVEPGPIAITANVSLRPSGKGQELVIELVASMPEVRRDLAYEIIDGALVICPYSKAIRGNVVVALKLT